MREKNDDAETRDAQRQQQEMAEQALRGGTAAAQENQLNLESSGGMWPLAAGVCTPSAGPGPTQYFDFFALGF